MRYYFAFGILLTLCLALRPAQATTTPPVILNELQWMGSSASTADEWIELRNTTEQSIDLSGWKLTKHSSGQQVPMLQIPAGTSIAAQGFVVISNYGVGAKSILQVSPTIINTDVALANSDLRIELLDAAGNVVDVAGTGDGNPPAGINTTADHILASMERNSEPGDGAQISNWHSATASTNLLPSATERATPGAQNSNGSPTIVLESEMTVSVHTPITIDASDTTDPENDTLDFLWTIGANELHGPTVQWSADTVGDISAVLRVRDGHTEVQHVLTIHVLAESASGSHTTLVPELPCSQLQLVELFPNPKGADTSEFLVVKNLSSEQQSLAGCRIQINDTRQYSLSGIVQGNSELLLQHLRFRLPNAAAHIELLDDAGKTLDHVQYPKTKEGRSWSRRESDWGWATPTPTTANAIFDPVEGTVLGASTERSTQERSTLRGTVIVPTGVLGTNYAVIQAPNGPIAVRTPAGILLSLRTAVTLVGKISTYQGYPSFIVDEKPKNTPTTAFTPTPVVLGDLDAQDQYRLVRISATIQSVRGSSFDVEDDSGEGTVTIKSATRIIRPVLRSGDRVIVDGMVLAGTTGLRIVPREQSDIQVVERAAPTTATTTEVVPVRTAATSSYWIAVAIGASCIGLWRLVQWYRNRSE
jgi:hypothetical protein